MKLNEQNYEENSIVWNSSKITEEMNTRVLIVAGSKNDLLSNNLYSVLKRDYSVIREFDECDLKNDESTYNLFSNKYFESYLIVHKIKAIVFTSELLWSITGRLKLEEWSDTLDYLVNVCKKNNVKILFVNIHNLFVLDEKKYKWVGRINGDALVDYSTLTQNRIASSEDNLILEISAVYGNHENLQLLDFVKYCNVETVTSDWLDYKVAPYLIDEVSIYISNNFSKNGCIVLDEISEITIDEWVRIIKNDNINKKTCIFSSPSEGRNIENKQRTCIFSLIYKLSPFDYYYGRSVAEERMKLGRRLAKSIPQSVICSVDCVIPVPKTGLYYAMGLAEELGLPYVQGLSKGNSSIRSFQVNSVDVRKSIIRNKIMTIPELLTGKKIILVDEAIFTGTTLKVVCKMLRDIGVSEIYLGIPSPKCYFQCSYYVQPKRSMLLEYVREEDLMSYFNVDGVFFQEREALEEYKVLLGDICMNCFLGEK